MAQIPTIGRIVHYHHPGEGVVSGEVQDFPAMILEVSGGPISPPPSSSSLEGDADVDAADTGLQTEGVPAVVADPVVCMLEIFRPRGTEWRRSSEGVEPGQWSWPVKEGAVTVEAISAALDQLNAAFATHCRDHESPDVPKAGTAPS